MLKVKNNKEKILKVSSLKCQDDSGFLIPIASISDFVTVPPDLMSGFLLTLY